jgi:hypothetical protein
LDQSVRDVCLRQQCLPRRARFDRDEYQTGFGQPLVNALGKCDEAPQHFMRRDAFGKVVLARIEQHQARPVLDDQLLEVRDAVGEAGTAQASLEHRGTAELTFEVVPQPHRGAADEDHRSRTRRLALVHTRKIANGVCPTTARTRAELLRDKSEASMTNSS